MAVGVVLAVAVAVGVAVGVAVAVGVGVASPAAAWVGTITGETALNQAAVAPDVPCG